MALEQRAEALHEQLLPAQRITGQAVAVEGMVQREEAVGELRIIERVRCEVASLVQPQRVHQMPDARIGQIEGAIAPALAARHAPRVRLGRIEDQQRARLRDAGAAPARELRTAGLGDRDHEGIVHMRRVLVGPEVRVQQVHARHVGACQ